MANPPPPRAADGSEPPADRSAARDLEREMGHDQDALDDLGVPPYHPTAAQREEEDRKGWSSWARWSAVGFEFGAAVGLFFLLGRYLDATWGTQPWLGVGGAGLGILLGMYVLIQKALRDEAAAPTPASKNDTDGPRRSGN